jgi:small conductance mechanosensitive channel
VSAFDVLRRLFGGPVPWPSFLLALIVTLGVAWLAARAVRRLAAAGLRAVARDTPTLSGPLVIQPLRLIAVAAFVCVVAILLFPAIEIAGAQPQIGFRLSTIAAWIFNGSGLKVVLIGVLAYFIIKVTVLLVRRFEYEVALGTDLDALERAKRARTLGSVVRNVTKVVVIGGAVLMVLRELSIDITPVLTGAGIVGLAVGFGAQTLVRDVISGFFMILEDQVRVGDMAAINGTPGLVEAINLRTIVLRDVEGTVHVFPNGAITTLANRSKDYSYYVIDVAVSYYQDPDRVAEVVRAAAAELQADPAYAPLILEPIEILGIDMFTEWSAQLKVRIKTVPLRQWDVGRELRRRLMKAFAEHGLPFPFPVPSTAVPPSQHAEGSDRGQTKA